MKVQVRLDLSEILIFQDLFRQTPSESPVLVPDQRGSGGSVDGISRHLRLCELLRVRTRSAPTR